MGNGRPSRRDLAAPPRSGRESFQIAFWAGIGHPAAWCGWICGTVPQNLLVAVRIRPDRGRRQLEPRWLAPTRAVEAGRRPLEREALTARSAVAATMEWEARQGFLLAGRRCHTRLPLQPAWSRHRAPGWAGSELRHGGRRALEGVVGAVGDAVGDLGGDRRTVGSVLQNRPDWADGEGQKRTDLGGIRIWAGLSRIPRRSPPRSPVGTIPAQIAGRGRVAPATAAHHRLQELFDHRGAVQTPAHQGAPTTTRQSLTPAPLETRTKPRRTGNRPVAGRDESRPARYESRPDPPGRVGRARHHPFKSSSTTEFVERPGRDGPRRPPCDESRPDERGLAASKDG